MDFFCQGPRGRRKIPRLYGFPGNCVLKWLLTLKREKIRNMLNRIANALKKDVVLTAAAILAVVSCFLVPPDGKYLGYIDFNTLILLFSLMLIVGGLRSQGVFQSIARVCERLVPFMSIFYVVGCIAILAINYDYLIPAVVAIVKSAFVPQAVAGGLVGRGIIAAAQAGMARGLFSNESGLGSAPLVASAAQTRNPVRQALVSATGTFWDTVVVCLMTGLVLVSTVMKNPAVDMAHIENGGQMTTAAFAQIPVLGPVILVFGIITFAYSTILGWSYYGERCAQYLLGSKAVLVYKLVFVAVVVVSPVVDLNVLWTVADILNALMAIPNLVAVLLLSGVIASETRRYIDHLDDIDRSEIPLVKR